jgi:hypothetical protein
MLVVAQAFQVYLDTITSKMKMCACARIHSDVASGWPPNSSETFTTSMPK